MVGVRLVRPAAVDQNFHAAEFGDALREKRFEAFAAGDVCGDFEGAAAHGADFFGGGGDEIQAAAGGDDVGAGECEAARDGEADAGGAADDDGGFVGEVQLGMGPLIDSVLLAR